MNNLSYIDLLYIKYKNILKANGLEERTYKLHKIQVIFFNMKNSYTKKSVEKYNGIFTEVST